MRLKSLFLFISVFCLTQAAGASSAGIGGAGTLAKSQGPVVQSRAAPALETGLDSEGTVQIMSFKDWRVSKVVEARAHYSKIESLYLMRKGVNPKDPSLKAIYNDLKSSKSRIDEVAELAVSDYFVGYLSGFKDQKRVFRLAAEKLSSSEVADLMTAYADSLLQTSGEGISTLSVPTASEASR